MSIYYCKQCRQAFLKDDAVFNSNRYMCKRCNVPLSTLGTEKGKLSLRAYMHAKNTKDSPAPIDIDDSKRIKPRDFKLPKKDPILIDCQSKLSINPRNTTALFTLCQWYYGLGYINESMAIAKQIIKIDPEFDDAHKFLTKKRESNKTNDQLPDNIETLQDMAYSYINKNELEKAVPILQKILTIDYKHAPSRRYLAEYFTQKENFHEAIDHLNVLTMIFPDDFRVYYNMAVTCYAMGDRVRALSNLKQAYLICNDDPDFSNDIKSMIDQINAEL